MPIVIASPRDDERFAGGKSAAGVAIQYFGKLVP
jgi:hypothetical protein